MSREFTPEELKELMTQIVAVPVAHGFDIRDVPTFLNMIADNLNEFMSSEDFKDTKKETDA